MFADLRDYTAFVERYGDAAAAALIADYRRLVRAEVSRAGGGEIKTEGDSFYVVFSSARLAIQCAVAILREAERARSRIPSDRSASAWACTRASQCLRRGSSSAPR